DPEVVAELTLKGVFSFLPDLAGLSDWLRPKFYYCEIKDETAFVDQDLLEKWAGEPTLKGAFLQRMLKRMAAATSAQEQRVVYLALAKGLMALRRGKEHAEG